MKLAKRILLGLIVLLVVAVGVDFAARMAAERRLEERFERLPEIEHAVLRLESWPYFLHARNESFDAVTLIVTLKRGKVRTYDPLVFHLRDASVGMTNQCPGRPHYIYAWKGDGHAVIPESYVDRLLRGQHGLEDVHISPTTLAFRTPNGTRHSVDESEASIRPNDVSGDIVLGSRPEVVILLSDVYGRVKFQGVQFDEGALILPFTVWDTAFCA